MSDSVRHILTLGKERKRLEAFTPESKKDILDKSEQDLKTYLRIGGKYKQGNNFEEISLRTMYGLSVVSLVNLAIGKG